MRIYKRQQFLSLPAGTIYAKGKPWAFDGFYVKGDTTGDDWTFRDLMWIDAIDDGDQWAKLSAMTEEGASVPAAVSYGRDGCFDDDEIFLVAERADLEGMRSAIDDAIEAASVNPN